MAMEMILMAGFCFILQPALALSFDVASEFMVKRLLSITGPKCFAKILTDFDKR